MPAEPVKYDIDLSGNKVDSERFPFSVWAKLLREAMSTRSRELMKVSPTGGIYELRKAIAEYLKSVPGDAGGCESDRHGSRNRVFVWYAGAAAWK